MNRKILIGLSWPFANNELHLGHISSSIPADILARYHRMVGDDVLLVSGTDSHGTKIELRAKKEGVSFKEIVDRNHHKFLETFEDFDMSFDLYSVTYDQFHETKVKELVKQMHRNGHIVPKIENRPFCPKCGKFVVDTELKIVCPVCGKDMKGDNCDCGYVPSEKDLKNATCLICGEKTVQKENRVLVFKITHFAKELEEHLNKNEGHWRANAVNETIKYLKDLQDRDFSRDLEWGIPVSIPGFEDKTIYTWFEALLGYVTDTMKVAPEKGWDWKDFWKKENKTEKRIYMVHAKDNIPFHTIILPSILLALEDNWCLPDWIVSSEYLTNNGTKISKSGEIGGFEAAPYPKTFNPDSLRYYFASNGPEKKDANFSVDLFRTVHNTEVVNKFGNLINRTLKFKGLEVLPDGKIDPEIRNIVKDAYKNVSDLIEKIEIKKAIATVMDVVTQANRFYDNKQPWVLAKEEDKTAFNDVIFTCAYVVANLSNLLWPVMPKTCEKIAGFLNLEPNAIWKEVEPKAGISLEKVEPLFERI